MYEKENFDDFVCTRCNHKVRKRIKNSLQVSLALTICAILLYIPAMIYPIMEVTTLGVKIQSTILEGVISFLNMNSRRLRLNSTTSWFRTFCTYALSGTGWLRYQQNE